MCHQETFANGRFLAINMIALDDEYGFSFGHKKALRFHVRPFFLGYRDRTAKPTVQLSVLVGFTSKEWMKIGSSSTFNEGFFAAQWVARQGES
jgi:hypothetical protein